MADKFYNLNLFFASSKEDEITLTYKQIEQILGFELKKSAYTHPAYFSNDADYHSICKCWLDNGYESFNNQLGKEISFRKINTKRIKYWLLPDNDENYDIEKSYLKYHTIDWHQDDKSVSVNDIIYFYKARPHQIVRFTCRVKKVNKKSPNKKDRDCYKNTTPYENKNNYMTLEFINRFETKFPDMSGLKQNGVSVVRRLMKIPETALKYIQKKEDEDYKAKRFDGTIPSDIPADHWSLLGGDEEELKEKAENDAKSLSDNDLFEKARQQESSKPKEKATTTSTYVRNVYVAEASKRRANGICQLCGQPAPFKDKNGNPYLESHHIIWLSEGGADSLENIVALCPNCHKKMHIVNDANDIKKLLKLNK